MCNYHVSNYCKMRDCLRLMMNGALTCFHINAQADRPEGAPAGCGVMEACAELEVSYKAGCFLSSVCFFFFFAVFRS